MEGNAESGSITDSSTFAQWYTDTPSVNVRIDGSLSLELNPDTGVFTFEDSAFFPLDGQGWDDTEGDNCNRGAHNFCFTTELRTYFSYTGGETFDFRGGAAPLPLPAAVLHFPRRSAPCHWLN